MQLLILGINHHAELALRERLVFPHSALPQALTALKQCLSPHLQEGFILSTCNRTEIYVVNSSHIQHKILNWLADYQSIAVELLTPHLYQLQQDEACRHLFRVMSGLDSMVLGEGQIVGQIKAAIAVAEKVNLLGPHLSLLLRHAFFTAKAVRTKTAISRHSVSIAAMTVRLSKRVFADCAQNILLIGAGKMVTLCGNHWCAQAPKTLSIANRSRPAAQALASQWQAHGIKTAVLAFEDLEKYLSHFDIILSCTASLSPIISANALQKAIQQRRQQPMLIFDLAMPRDIDPNAQHLDDIFLYSLDDLATFIREGQAARQACVTQAAAIIEQHLQDFIHKQYQQQLSPLICHVREQGQRLLQEEIKRAEKLLSRGIAPQQALQQLGQRLVNKFLHGHFHTLHQARPAEREALETLLPRLLPFTLDHHSENNS